MFKLIGMKPPKPNPFSYIVVLEEGVFWANESGAITEAVAPGTFHRTTESSNPFAEAMLVASVAMSNFSGMERRLTDKIAEVVEAVRGEASDPAAARRRGRAA